MIVNILDTLLGKFVEFLCPHCNEQWLVIRYSELEDNQKPLPKTCPHCGGTIDPSGVKAGAINI